MTNQELFNVVVSARRPEYAVKREQLLSAAGVKSFLEDQASANASGEGRWLAEILLARLANPQEFERLEREFDEKVRHVKLGYPVLTAARRPIVRADILDGLLTPEEAVPVEATSGRDLAPQVIRFYQGTQLSVSDCWKPFLGELLLKGWSPTKVAPAPEPKPLAEQKLDENGIPRERKPTLASDDYVRQAVLLLGKLGEPRAVPHIVDLLVDKSQDGRTRLLAARALGFVKSDSSIEAILRLVEDEQTPPWVRIEIFSALARLKDDRAVPVLERIAANPDDTMLPGGLGPARWKREAQSALMKIRAE